MTSGVGIGMLVSGPIIQHLLENYELSGTYLMSATIASHIIPCGMLLKTPPKKKQMPAETTNGNEFFKTYIKLEQTPAYLCVLVGGMLWNIATLSIWYTYRTLWFRTGPREVKPRFCLRLSPLARFCPG